MSGQTNRNGRRSGRILPHERECDNDAPVIDGNIEIENYEDEVSATTKLEKNDGTRKDYRRRIKAMVGWLEKEHPGYYMVGCRVVSDEDLNNSALYYYGRYKHDLVYRGMNVKYIIRFLLKNKF